MVRTNKNQTKIYLLPGQEVPAFTAIARHGIWCGIYNAKHRHQQDEYLFPALKLQHAQIAFPDMAGPPRALWDDGSAQASATIWISLQSWLFCQPLDQPWLALYRGHRQSSYARHSP